MTKPLPPEKKRAAKDHPWRKHFEPKPVAAAAALAAEKVIPYHARMGVRK